MNAHYLQTGFVWGTGMLGTLWEFIQGNYHNAVFILVCLMLMDFVTGILKGAKNKRLKSAIMHSGITKKAGILVSIIFAYLLDILLNDAKPIFTSLMTWISIGNEGLSIIENLTALGVRFPAIITDKLGSLSDKTNDKETK